MLEKVSTSNARASNVQHACDAQVANGIVRHKVDHYIKFTSLLRDGRVQLPQSV